MPPAEHRSASRGIEVERPEAMLALWSALLWAAENDVPSRWSPDEWEKFVRALSPREIVVVAMHVVRGLTFVEVGAWLGASRARVEQHMRKVERKLAEIAGEFSGSERSL